MRTIDSSILVIKPSNFAWWHRSWTGRFVLAALLIAAAAFALMPDRASAQGITDYCKSDTAAQGIDDADVDITNGVIPSSVFNKGLQSDCIALLTVAGSLYDDNDGPNDDFNDIVNSSPVNWIDLGTNDSLPNLIATTWQGVTVEDPDADDTDTDVRVTQVILPSMLSGGILSPQWADLTALSSLNLSDNNLSGPVPRRVWEFFNGLDAGNLMLDGNANLEPSPTLTLKAAATKNTDGDSEVALSWDSVWWYSLEVTGYEYRYSTDDGTTWATNTEADSDGWQEASGLSAPDTLVTPKPTAQVTLPSPTDLPSSNNYIFETRAIKTDLGADMAPDATDDDTPTMSGVSRIYVVGPQTVTAKNNYTLTVETGYMVSGTAPDEDTIVVVPDAEAMNILFTPEAATDEVTVELAPTADDATWTSHTFTVEILPADSAPTVKVIPRREVVNQRRATRVDLNRYFLDDDLTFEVSSSNEKVATVEADGYELLITTLREGRTDITVTATNPDQGMVSETFRVTVVDPNNAPQLIGNIPDLTLYLDDAGTQVDMTPFFRDQDNEFLRFIPQSSNPMVVTATSVGRNVIFNVNGLGEITMTIIAQDGAGATAFGSFKVTVLDPNAAPQAVGTIPPQTIRLEDPGLALSLGAYFTDSDNDPLTYRAVSADETIVTVEVTEAIVTLTAAGVGGTTVTVTATDPGGKSATQEILVTVLPANRPPEVVGQIPDQTLQYNDEPLGLDVTMYFTDPDGDELSYVGEGTDESVAEIRVHSDGLVRVDPLSHGEIEVTVTARDPLGASVSQSFMVTVEGNLPPEAVGVIEDQVLLEGGSALTINVAKYFSDPNGDELTYMATSSNTDAVQAVVIDGSSELVLRPFAPAEEVTVTVTAMDPEGESAAQLVMVSVAAAAPPPTATPMPTATPEPTATQAPAPTATPVPTDEGGGFPVGLIIVLLLVLAGVAAAVFIIQRRR